MSPTFIKAAAREVTEEDGVTVTPSEEGFATVAGVRRLGRIPVLMVRMNVDLLSPTDTRPAQSSVGRAVPTMRT